MPAGPCLLLVLLLAPEAEQVDFGKTTDQRVRLLRHGNPAVRQRAAFLLRHAPGDRALAGLLLSLTDGSAMVREAAAEALLSIGDERAVPFLARRIREEREPRVLRALLLALARCGSSYAARLVEPFLEHPNREVRAAAATALGRIGDAGQRDALWAALRYAPDDAGMVVRSAVLGAFVELGWHDDVVRAIRELEEAGAHRHWLSRVAVVSAVGAARLAERGPWLRELFVSEDDPRVLAAAAASLGRLGYLDDIVAGLDHRSPDVRRAALVGLEEAGDARAAPRARALLESDPDPAVRLEAALVLAHLGEPDADVYLVDALRSENALFWMTALSTLEERHGTSYGRDPEAWTKFLKSSR